MTMLSIRRRQLASAVLAGAALLSSVAAFGGTPQDDLSDAGNGSDPVVLPTGVRLVRNLAYGADDQQRLDIHLPPQPVSGAPVIFMVHGGAWRHGDKGAKTVVENKVARWVPKGFIFISVNYRLASTVAPIEQARDVATALAVAQGKAAAWGGDPAKFILMGHSAGAHLVALLGASPALALRSGARPWLGTVALDSAALDVPQLMGARHLPLYDRAFGRAPAAWATASPYQALGADAPPFLLVCSSQRKDSCLRSHQFADKAVSLHVRASVLEQDATHKEINQQLGAPGAYTDAVEAFMRSLDAAVMRDLQD